MNPIKTPDNYFTNLDNVNFFFVVKSNKYAVCGIFGTKPGNMTDGVVIKDDFESVKEAEKWILDIKG